MSAGVFTCAKQANWNVNPLFTILSRTSTTTLLNWLTRSPFVKTVSDCHTKVDSFVWSDDSLSPNGCWGKLNTNTSWRKCVCMWEGVSPWKAAHYPSDSQTGDRNKEKRMRPISRNQHPPKVHPSGTLTLDPDWVLTAGWSATSGWNVNTFSSYLSTSTRKAGSLKFYLSQSEKCCIYMTELHTWQWLFWCIVISACAPQDQD